MNNKEKAKEIAENSKQYFYHDEYECGLACALRMAQWKDEQYRQKLEMILNAPNEVIRIELLTKLIHNKL